jgi:hypothetical protein
VSHHCPCSLLIVDTTSDHGAEAGSAAVDGSRES